MTKTLVDCGNCGPDFNAIRKLAMSNFDVVVVQTHGAEDTIEVIKSRQVDLITVNRKLDRDYSDGLDVIKQLKASPETAGVPVMLVTNYDEHQNEAISHGAVRGFGKLSIPDPTTKELIATFLDDKSPASVTNHPES